MEERNVIRLKASHFLWISTAHAAVFTILLGFLHVFKFISWHPLNWTERFLFYPQAPIWLKWSFTFILVLIIVSIVIGIFLLLKKMPAIITSIVFGVVAWLLLEWIIYQDFTHIGWHSIPVLTVILLISRALAETVVYYDRTIYDDERK
jgi:hypothetical protein